MHDRIRFVILHDITARRFERFSQLYIGNTLAMNAPRSRTVIRCCYGGQPCELQLGNGRVNDLRLRMVLLSSGWWLLRRYAGANRRRLLPSKRDRYAVPWRHRRRRRRRRRRAGSKERKRILIVSRRSRATR